MKFSWVIPSILIMLLLTSCAEYPEEQAEEFQAPVQTPAPPQITPEPSPEITPQRIHANIQFKDQVNSEISFDLGRSPHVYESEKIVAIPSEIPNEMQIELPNPSIWINFPVRATVYFGAQTKELATKTEAIDQRKARIIVSGFQYIIPEGKSQRASIELRVGAESDANVFKVNLVTPPEVTSFQRTLLKQSEINPILLPPVTLFPLISFEMRNTSDYHWMFLTRPKHRGALIQATYQEALSFKPPCDFQPGQINYQNQIVATQFLLASSTASQAELSELLTRNPDSIQKTAVPSGESLRMILYGVFSEEKQRLQLMGQSKPLRTMKFSHACENLPKPFVFRPFEIIYETLLKVNAFEFSEVRYEPALLVNEMKGTILPYSKQPTDYYLGKN